MRFNLFTTWYEEKNPARRAELLACLEINAGAFDAVHVLCEGDGPPVAALNARQLLRRQKYADVLEWIVEVSGDDINVIANCDLIIPCASLRAVANLRSDEAMSLARWDIVPHKGLVLWNVNYSNDVWIIRGKPKPNIGGDYFFGVPGCDNRFTHELDAAGYRVSNPAKTIKTYHLHASAIRTATNSKSHRVLPPYLFITPTELGEPETYRRIGR